MSTLDRIVEKYGTGRKGKIEIPDMDREDLAHLFHELGFTVGVEVGTERGQYAKAMLTRNPDLKLYCVDPWIAYQGYREHVTQEKLDWLYSEAVTRLEGLNAVLVRKFSHDAAADFKDESIDFVYIDGNHEFRHVVNDIADWTPKVRKGGIVSGHDYIQRNNEGYLMGVVEAVTGYVGAYHIDPLFVVGTKPIVEGQKRDRPRSWFFIKD